MKIRTDFVTNSSSSSFVTMRIESKELTEVLSEFQEMLMEENCCDIYIDEENGQVEIHQEDSYCDIGLQKDEPGGIVDIVAGFFDYEFYECNYRYFGDGKEISKYESEEEFYDLDEFSELTQVLMEKRKELAESILSAEISVFDTGWEGDSDVRYDREWYDEEILEDILETIAEQNGCSVEEVDDEMFCEYVGSETSESEETLTYDKKTGMFERFSRHGLL